MKLRQKSKRNQALDAAASVAKTWSEWRLGEKVAKTASKASRAAKGSKKSKKSSAPNRKPVKIAGVIALVGGIGAAVAKKLGGGKAEPLYTPPGAGADMPAPPRSPDEDIPPALITEEPALTASKEPPPRDPSLIVIGDLAESPADVIDTPAVNEPIGADEPEAAPVAEAYPPSGALAPDPEDLISDTADPQDVANDTADPQDTDSADDPSDKPA